MADLTGTAVRARLLELATLDNYSEELRQAVSVLRDCIDATRLVDPRAARRGSLPRAIEALSTELARVEQRRDALPRELPATLAVRLTVLRERGVYPRISSFEQDRCAACNAQVPAVLVEAVRQEGNDFCPNCKRVLASGCNSDGCETSEA